MSGITFGGATTDRLSCGSAADIDDLAAATVLVAAYITTHTAGRCLFGKGGYFTLALNTTHGASNLQFYRERATTNTLYRTNDGRATVNAWHFFGVTFDSGASPQVHIYESSPDGSLTECTYGTSTDGTGALFSDAAANFEWGNNGTGGGVGGAVQGTISYGQLYNRVLTVEEMKKVRATWRRLDGCLIYTRLGSNGTGTHRDETGLGHNGTLTGGSLATRGYPARTLWWDDEDDVVVSAGGGGNEALLRRYRNNHLGAMV